MAKHIPQPERRKLTFLEKLDAYFEARRDIKRFRTEEAQLLEDAVDVWRDVL